MFNYTEEEDERSLDPEKDLLFAEIMTLASTIILYSNEDMTDFLQDSCDNNLNVKFLNKKNNAMQMIPLDITVTVGQLRNILDKSMGLSNVNSWDDLVSQCKKSIEIVREFPDVQAKAQDGMTVIEQFLKLMNVSTKEYTETLEEKKKQLYDKYVNKLMNQIKQEEEKIENIEEYLNECRKIYISKCKCYIGCAKEQLENIGDYYGQCLHEFTRYDKNNRYKEMCTVCGLIKTISYR